MKLSDGQVEALVTLAAGPVARWRRWVGAESLRRRGLATFVSHTYSLTELGLVELERYPIAMVIWIRNEFWRFWGAYQTRANAELALQQSIAKYGDDRRLFIGPVATIARMIHDPTFPLPATDAVHLHHEGTPQ